MGFNKCEFAGNLRALRARRRLTQQEVGKAVGVDTCSIANYENEKMPNIPNFEVSWKLADLYGVSMDELGGRRMRLR